MYNLLSNIEDIFQGILGIGAFIIFIIIAFHLFFPIIAGVIAHNKNRCVIGWMLCVIIFGAIGFIIIVALPNAEPKNQYNYYGSNSANSYAPPEGWKCKFCGKTNSRLLSSCSNCKKKKTDVLVLPNWTCSNCGSENGPNASVCYHCRKYRY